MMADKTITQLTATTSAVAADEIPIWVVGSAVTRKITKANFLQGAFTGGGTVATGGYTLTVPATGTAALYATGSWSPTLIGSGSNPTNTYTVQLGSYIKINTLVIASFNVRISNTSGGTGNIRIGGLPYAARTLTSYVAVGSVEALVDLSAGNTALLIEIGSGAQHIDLIQYGDNTGGSFIALSALSFTSYFIGTICYESA